MPFQAVPSLLMNANCPAARVLNVAPLPLFMAMDSVSVPAVPRWCMVYSRPAHVEAAGSVTVTSVVPVYALQLSRSSNVRAPVKVVQAEAKEPALCRVLVGAVMPIPIRADGVTLDATTVTRSLVSPPTAIRTEDVPVVVFRFVILVMSSESKYAISPSTTSVPTPKVAAAFLFPSVLSQWITLPEAVAPGSATAANVAFASVAVTLPTENLPPRGCNCSG